MILEASMIMPIDDLRQKSMEYVYAMARLLVEKDMQKVTTHAMMQVLYSVLALGNNGISKIASQELTAKVQ